MAENSERCLACNNIVPAGRRRALNTESSSVVVPCLKNILLRQLENDQERTEAGLDGSLDDLISKSFVCRPCFRAYESYIDKGNKLYESIDTRCVRNTMEDDQSTRKRKNSGQGSVLPKKHCSASEGSPSVSVSAWYIAFIGVIMKLKL